MTHIVHMTSVHPRYDTRIVLKECKAVLRAGFKCTLIVADGAGEANEHGLHIMDVGAPSSRATRMTLSVWRVFRLAKQLNADVYHFHDPELIPVGLRLHAAGKIVIYDMHEDVTADILSKHWIALPLRRLVSSLFGYVEKHAVKKLSAIVTAWPYLREKFQAFSDNVVDIVNYAMDDELFIESTWCDRPRDICYIGGISNIRGIYEILEALKYCDAQLTLGGNFHERETEVRARSMPTWSRVNYLGFVSRKQAAEIMSRSRIGLVTFLPEPNHLNAMPNKLFEYMSAGLPVVASNFPRWREIVEKHACGICVDPTDAMAIANAIQYLLDHAEEAEKMGANGRKATLGTFNWYVEERRLIQLYIHLLSQRREVVVEPAHSRSRREH